MDLRIENLRQLAEPGTVRLISRQLGTNESVTREAVNAAIPLLLSALAIHAAERHGLTFLHRVLHDSHGGEAILDDLPTYLGTGQARHANGLIKHVLGKHPDEARSLVVKASGIDEASAGELLVILTPLVLAVLARVQRGQGLDDQALADRMLDVLWESPKPAVPV